MPENIIQPVKGKTVQRVTLEMDVKGVSSVKAETVDPFGKVHIMNPVFLASFLAQILSVVVSDIYRSMMQGPKTEEADADKKIIT